MQIAAVLPAAGIGDALLMMIASHQLKKKGYHVVTFHPALPQLSSWFPGHSFLSEPTTAFLQTADLILIENDNSPKISKLHAQFPSQLSLFYPTYSSTKHLPLSCRDHVFDKKVPMAENIARATASLLSLSSFSKDNGITPLPTLLHRKHQKRVLFHPMSRERQKNWRPEGFLKVARILKKQGFEPIFCVSPEERHEWLQIIKEEFPLPELPTLSDLACLVYESGYVIGNDSLLGHLASNLQIPTLIIANDEKRMDLWRPDWLQGELVLPPRYLPNWKFLRLKEKQWQRFISPRHVLHRFDVLRDCL